MLQNIFPFETMEPAALIAPSAPAGDATPEATTPFQVLLEQCVNGTPATAMPTGPNAHALLETDDAGTPHGAISGQSGQASTHAQTHAYMTSPQTDTPQPADDETEATDETSTDEQPYATNATAIAWMLMQGGQMPQETPRVIAMPAPAATAIPAETPVVAAAAAPLSGDTGPASPQAPRVATAGFGTPFFLTESAWQREMTGPYAGMAAPQVGFADGNGQSAPTLMRMATPSTPLSPFVDDKQLRDAPQPRLFTQASNDAAPVQQAAVTLPPIPPAVTFTTPEMAQPVFAAATLPAAPSPTTHATMTTPAPAHNLSTASFAVVTPVPSVMTPVAVMPDQVDMMPAAMPVEMPAQAVDGSHRTDITVAPGITNNQSAAVASSPSSTTPAPAPIPAYSTGAPQPPARGELTVAQMMEKLPDNGVTLLSARSVVTTELIPAANTLTTTGTMSASPVTPSVPAEAVPVAAHDTVEVAPQSATTTPARPAPTNTPMSSPATTGNAVTSFIAEIFARGAIKPVHASPALSVAASVMPSLATETPPVPAMPARTIAQPTGMIPTPETVAAATPIDMAPVGDTATATVPPAITTSATPETAEVMPSTAVPTRTSSTAPMIDAPHTEVQSPVSIMPMAPHLDTVVVPDTLPVQVAPLASTEAPSPVFPMMMRDDTVSAVMPDNIVPAPTQTMHTQPLPRVSAPAPTISVTPLPEMATEVALALDTPVATSHQPIPASLPQTVAEIPDRIVQMTPESTDTTHTQPLPRESAPTPTTSAMPFTEMATTVLDVPATAMPTETLDVVISSPMPDQVESETPPTDDTNVSPVAVMADDQPAANTPTTEAPIRRETRSALPLPVATISTATPPPVAPLDVPAPVQQAVLAAAAMPVARPVATRSSVTAMREIPASSADNNAEMTTGDADVPETMTATVLGNSATVPVAELTATDRDITPEIAPVASSQQSRVPIITMIPRDERTGSPARNDDVLSPNATATESRPVTERKRAKAIEIPPTAQLEMPVTRSQDMAPTRQSDTTASVQPRRIIEQVADAVARQLPTERHTLVLRLDPPELGALHLRVTAHAGDVVAHIETANPVIRELLETRLPEMQRVLQNAGVDVSRCSVSLSTQTGHGQGQSWHAGQHTASSARVPAHAAAHGEEAAPMPPPVARVSGNGNVDYFA